MALASPASVRGAWTLLPSHCCRFTEQQESRQQYMRSRKCAGSCEQPQFLYAALLAICVNNKPAGQDGPCVEGHLNDGETAIIQQ